MGTLDTFNSWAYGDFEHIGEIQKHFEHIQIEIGDIHEDIGDIGHFQILAVWDFEHIGQIHVHIWHIQISGRLGL